MLRAILAGIIIPTEVPMAPSNLVLLTGPREAGKTTACLRFCDRARRLDLRLGGILCPATYGALGVKTGFEALDPASGERRRLATVIASSAAGQRVGPYHFDAAVMAWALNRVLWALAEPLDAAILDEIGPLELDQGAGFAPALDRLSDARPRLIILIVRPALLGRLQALLAAHDPQLVALERAYRDEVPVQLLRLLMDASSSA
jgi:nucleoside-triphosphatase THEP1